MAAPAPHAVPVGPETLIAVKILLGNTTRRFKLPLRDLGAHVLPHKLRALLALSSGVDVTYERFSDSAGAYIKLDSNNPAVYKQLYRAAKAKLKLRIKATVTAPQQPIAPVSSIMDEPQPRAEMLHLPTPPKVSPSTRPSYLATVLTASSEQCQPSSSFADPDLAVPADGSSSRSPAAPIVLPEKKPMFATQNTSPEMETATKLSALTLADDGVTLEAPGSVPVVSGPVTIDCNHCGFPVPDEHYHCSICDDGDFDLCPACVAADVTCGGDGHWLIRRRIQNGHLVHSVTETIGPKTRSSEQASGVAEEEKKKKSTTFVPYTSRTCNSCIHEIGHEELLTCTNCADYDLCMMCFSLDDHGHHPGHRFHPVSGQTCNVSSRILSLCEPGRGVAHAAICDGCDEHILGVRHKCLSCPDWDYCSSCVLSAPQNHPGHRFAPLFDELVDVSTADEVHFGIYCDGPLCASQPHKRYIHGTRYKCSVCHDTDFCANCEALPMPAHNRTHPLIKFKTPVRHVSVTTFADAHHGRNLPPMGDQRVAKNAATETVPVTNPSGSATEDSKAPEPAGTKAGRIDGSAAGEAEASEGTVGPHLRAVFLYDEVVDGSVMAVDQVFTQAWTLENPGPQAWPAGCALHFSGGDQMLNVDTKNPSSVTALVSATKSTVMNQAVQPGEEAEFRVVLKAPSFVGRAISYWRLKTPEGVTFGHKLWVDVNVTSTRAPDGAAEDAAKSCMIFPQLEKESPGSSVHATGTAAEAERHERGEGTASTARTEEKELSSEAESLHFDEDGETDDGFLTDEEYDILDASDEDLLVEARGAVGK